jgi:hypothetical protein
MHTPQTRVRVRTLTSWHNAGCKFLRLKLSVREALGQTLVTYCYDCGRPLAHSEAVNLAGALVCCHCAEIVASWEAISGLPALVRRALFRVHSNTADPRAAGWRRPGSRPLWARVLLALACPRRAEAKPCCC